MRVASYNGDKWINKQRNKVTEQTNKSTAQANKQSSKDVSKGGEITQG